MAGSPKAAANVIISLNSLDCMRAGEDCSFTGRRRRVAVARAFARLSLSLSPFCVCENHTTFFLFLFLSFCYSSVFFACLAVCALDVVKISNPSIFSLNIPSMSSLDHAWSTSTTSSNASSPTRASRVNVIVACAPCCMRNAIFV